MAFVCGPRQVGKTTIAKVLMKISKNSSYRNWDIPEDREKIVAGSFKPLLEDLIISPATHPLLILDESHSLLDRYWAVGF